jgi:hypothetical protein
MNIYSDVNGTAILELSNFQDSRVSNRKGAYPQEVVVGLA